MGEEEIAVLVLLYALTRARTSEPYQQQPERRPRRPEKPEPRPPEEKPPEPPPPQPPPEEPVEPPMPPPERPPPELPEPRPPLPKPPEKPLPPEPVEPPKPMPKPEPMPLYDAVIAEEGGSIVVQDPIVDAKIIIRRDGYTQVVYSRPLNVNDVNYLRIKTRAYNMLGIEFDPVTREALAIKYASMKKAGFNVILSKYYRDGEVCARIVDFNTQKVIEEKCVKRSIT